MSKRGTIMRDPSVGPGLVMVQGQQFHFALEGTWKSETLPRPGLVVEVDFDPAGQVRGLVPVSESQLVREQANAALAAARSKGGALASGLVARFGALPLAAAAALLTGWFALSAVSIDAAFLGNLRITFWQVLAFLNTGNPLQMLAADSGGPGTGIYGLLAVACIAGPFLAFFWHDRRAHLGGLLPLAFMVMVALLASARLSAALGIGDSGAMGFGAGAEYAVQIAELQRQAQAEATEALSIGLGVYLSALASLYFAALGLRNFLIRSAADRTLGQE